MNKKKKQNGFTIVELVIVIAVIGILAAVLIPTFSNLIKKSKQSADQQLVYHLNEAVAANEVDNLAKGKNGTEATMYDTLQVLDKEYGFTVERMTPRSGNDIVWDSTTNRFALVAKDNKVIYTDPNRPTADMTNKAQMWRITEAGETLGDGYSHYLTAGWTGEVPAVVTGLDVGENDDITSVTYANDGEAQTVVIRTNSANTTLTIDDESEGTINHYGVAGALNIIQCHTASYHENGNVAFAEISKGRIVLESGSKIEHIHINKKDENTFDKVFIKDNGAEALPTAITRDEVAVTDASGKTEVVTVESSAGTETVYVYGTAAAGTTQKITTGENKQNEDVDTALGSLVLDNGTAGQKALTGNEKTEAKTELVNEAKAPEIAKELEEDTTAVIYNLTTGEYYDNLYSAIESVPVNIKTILVLLKNINGVSNKNYQIDDNQIIVFDLNGHTMNTVAPDGNTAYAIENKGTLTIKDNSDTLKNGTGKGKLELNALNPDLQAIPGYASNLITNMGNLTVESGWLYNASTGTAAYAIDLNSNNGRNVSLVINGGKITTNGSLSIRQQVHANTTNDVTINGGIIGSFWIQNYGNSSTSANGNLNINGGEFLYKIRLDTGYSIDHEYDIKAENVHVNINGGTFNGTITVYENGNNGQFTIFGGTFDKEITYYGEVKFIRGGTFNVSPVLKSDGYPYATVDGGGFGFYNLTDLLNSAGTTLEDILNLDLETQIDTYGFGLEYWESPSIVNKQYGGSDCYDVVRYVTPSYDEYINDGFIAINNNDGTITVVAE